MRVVCSAAVARSLNVLLIVSAALLGATALPAAAQSPAPARVVIGRVVDVEAHAPLPGATVSAGNVRTATDADGAFTLDVPAGVTAIDVSAEGFLPLSTPLDAATAGAPLELLLVRAPNYMTTVDVVAAPSTPTPAAQIVAPVQVLQTAGSLDNIFRTLQTLPGVAATEEIGSRLTVRGGAPDQNLTVMDGVEIHDPYRLYGLTSAFNPEIIRRFELATGGFSVKHGDRLSSLLTVENRDGVSGKGLAGSAAISITDANLVFEGGLPGKAEGSWLVTGRRTYYDLVAERFTNQDLPKFADLQTRVNWQVSPGRTLTLFGLRSRQTAALSIDEDDARGTFDDDTDNDVLSGSFDMTIGTRGRSHSVVSYSNTRSIFGVDASFENQAQRSNAPNQPFDTATVVFNREFEVRDVSARQELAWTLGAHVVETGADVHRLQSRLWFSIAGDRNPTAANGSSVQGGAGLPDLLASSSTTTRGAVWLQDTWRAGQRGSIEGGLRLDRVGATREWLLSPRVAGTVSLGGDTRLKAAIGRYTQSPGYEKLIQGDFVFDLTNETQRTLRSQRAVLASAGIEHPLGAGVVLKVEGYYKRFTDLLLGRLETESERQARLAKYDFPAALAWSLPVDPIITTIPTNDSRGRAYGFDVFLSRMTAPTNARITGWASYTWGKADRDSYGRRYPFEYDRRHAATIVGSYRLASSWNIATTVRLASGFPRTSPVGLRVAAMEDALDADRDGNTSELIPARDASGLLVYGVDYGSVANLYQSRLPMFARADARLTWRPHGGRGRWEYYVEVINVLNRRNAGAFDPVLEYNPASDRPRLTEEPSQSLMRLPTLGVRVKF